jgi:gas vesicle protein
MDNRDTTSFLTGLILGAVVGLAIGFLYAPKSGEETRKLLKEKAIVAKQKVTEVAKKVKQTADEATKKAQTALE